MTEYGRYIFLVPSKYYQEPAPPPQHVQFKPPHQNRWKVATIVLSLIVAYFMAERMLIRYNPTLSRGKYQVETTAAAAKCVAPLYDENADNPGLYTENLQDKVKTLRFMKSYLDNCIAVFEDVDAPDEFAIEHQKTLDMYKNMNQEVSALYVRSTTANEQEMNVVISDLEKIQEKYISIVMSHPNK